MKPFGEQSAEMEFQKTYVDDDAKICWFIVRTPMEDFNPDRSGLPAVLETFIGRGANWAIFRTYWQAAEECFKLYPNIPLRQGAKRGSCKRILVRK